MNVHKKLNRREMLARCSTGFGLMALQGLMASPAFAGAAQRSHFRPRAKHVILCYMSGGVSQVDTFDPKPKLRELHGKPMPVKVERTQFNNNGNVMASPFEFKQHGQSGSWVSSLLPHLSSCVDDLTFFHTLVTRSSSHTPACFQMNTGSTMSGFPSLGAWLSYGLGTVTHQLPSFRTFD